MNSSPVIPSLSGGDKRKTIYIVVASIILFIVSVVSVFDFNRAMIQKRVFDFDKLVDGLTLGFVDKFADVESLLYDLRGEISEENQDGKGWTEYLLLSDLEKRFPGMYSLAFAELVNNSYLDSFEKNLRVSEKAFPEYVNYFVFPPSESPQLFPVKYLHTRDRDLSLLLGFDFGYAHEITDALKISIESNNPVISENISLDAIIPNSTQRGYTMVIPTYGSAGAGELSPEDREKVLTGFVAAWLNPQKMFSGVVVPGVSFEVFDGGEMIFSSAAKKEVGSPLAVSREIKLFNKIFRVDFSSTAELVVDPIDRFFPAISLAVALLINSMWYVTVYLILSSRGKAVRLAETATADLVKFKQAVDGVSDHVVMTNDSGVIIYVNKAAERTTGYLSTELLGRTPSVWGGQMSKEFYVDFWKTIKNDKKPFSGQITNKRKGGDLYEVETTVSPIINENGEVQYFVGIERDVTKQKAVDRMKTEFISLASHQLRTPLSAVKWFGKMLSDGDAGPLTVLQAEYLDKVNESNEREIKLVNALLNVSRIESGKIIVDPKPTKIRELVDLVVNEVKMDPTSENKELNWDVEEDVPEMNIDADLVRHIYINLLINAMRYTGDGGRVELKVFVKEGALMSEVTDNGIGIPVGEQGRVFEKFFRASNATKKETDGNGLGLYLAKTVVESSGGKIGFETEEGKGTTFWFTLPLSGMGKKDGDLTMV